MWQRIFVTYKELISRNFIFQFKKCIYSLWQHPVKEGICLLLLLHQLRGPVGNYVLQITRVFLQLVDHVVHDVHLPVRMRMGFVKMIVQCD